MENQNSYEGKCQSYIKKEGELIPCERKGRRRIDHGLDSGIHCDSCWGKMVLECRSRSW